MQQKGRIQDLKEVIPSLADKKASTVVVISKAREYIIYLESKIRELLMSNHSPVVSVSEKFASGGHRAGVVPIHTAAVPLAKSDNKNRRSFTRDVPHPADHFHPGPVYPSSLNSISNYYPIHLSTSSYGTFKSPNDPSLQNNQASRNKLLDENFVVPTAEPSYNPPSKHLRAETPQTAAPPRRYSSLSLLPPIDHRNISPPSSSASPVKESRLNIHSDSYRTHLSPSSGSHLNIHTQESDYEKLKKDFNSRKESNLALLYELTQSARFSNGSIALPNIEETQFVDPFSSTNATFQCGECMNKTCTSYNSTICDKCHSLCHFECAVRPSGNSAWRCCSCSEKGN